MDASNPTSCLGILSAKQPNIVPPVVQNFWIDLTIAGLKVNVKVLVFCLQDIDWKQETVQGYRYARQQKCWMMEKSPLPQLIYDRYFAPNQQSLDAYRLFLDWMRRSARYILLNPSLANKWTISQVIAQDDFFHNYVPRTEKFHHWRQLSLWLKEQKQVILKPTRGMQGKRIFHISQERTHPLCIYIRGRDAMNRAITEQFTTWSTCCNFLSGIMQHRSYLLQSYCELQNHQSNPFDVRVLVQKSYDHRMQVVGIAVRQGTSGQLTSNLHGGGTSFPLLPYLSEQFGSTHAQLLQDTLKQLALRVTSHLEKTFGPIFELGIDLGIDRQAHIWLLEVNSKPGRTILKHSDLWSSYQDSIQAFIQYAMYAVQERFKWTPFHRNLHPSRFRGTKLHIEQQV